MWRLTSILISLSMLTSCAGNNGKPVFAEIKYIYESVSPAVAGIIESEGTARQTALGALTDRAQAEGTPLIEEDPLTEGYVYATFIYLDSAGKHNVEFQVCGIYDEYRFGDRKLIRLDSSPVYYRTYMIPDDLCFAYRYILTDGTTGEKRTVTDPLNPGLIPTGALRDYSWSVLDLRPGEQDWFTKRHHAPASRLDNFIITSRILGNTRNVYVYLPAGYDESAKDYPVIYLFDSFIYLNRVEVPNVLDNLIIEKKIEPLVAVFIDNPTATSRNYELPMNPLFRDFITGELLPEISSRYRVTADPRKTIVGGMSYGGLAAAYLAFEHPELFGKVLSQSGGFWRDMTLKTEGGEEYRGDWLINRYLREEKKNLKIYLDWGLQENVVLGSNRKFAGILEGKGYDFRFTEFNGWHDWSNSRKTFPAGLMYLLEE